jgi:hypothetical protein
VIAILWIPQRFLAFRGVWKYLVLDHVGTIGNNVNFKFLTTEEGLYKNESILPIIYLLYFFWQKNFWTYSWTKIQFQIIIGTIGKSTKMMLFLLFQSVLCIHVCCKKNEQKKKFLWNNLMSICLAVPYYSKRFKCWIPGPLGTLVKCFC